MTEVCSGRHYSLCYINRINGVKIRELVLDMFGIEGFSPLICLSGREINWYDYETFIKCFRFNIEKRHAVDS